MITNILTSLKIYPLMYQTNNLLYHLIPDLEKIYQIWYKEISNKHKNRNKFCNKIKEEIVSLELSIRRKENEIINNICLTSDYLIEY